MKHMFQHFLHSMMHAHAWEAHKHKVARRFGFGSDWANFITHEMELHFSFERL